MKIFIKVGLTSLSLVMSTFTSAAQYQFTDLGSLGGVSGANSINEVGQIVGGSTVNNQFRAFIYENGVMSDLGIQNNTVQNSATGLNDLGQIIGLSSASPEDFRIATSFLYDNGQVTDLGNLGGNYTGAAGINNQGKIVGSSKSVNNHRNAFLYENGSIQNIGTLGGDNSHATEINNVGQIVGYASDESYKIHPFLYENGVMQALPSLSNSVFSVASDINDLGQIIGGSYKDITVTGSSAFLYDNGSLINLGGLGTSFITANQINNLGQIVGSTSENGVQVNGAFLYENGQMFDLNTLVDESLGDWSIVSAADINDNGLIVGQAFNETLDQYHAYLLTPVPEPSIYAMMGLGVFGLVAFSRKQKLH